MMSDKSFASIPLLSVAHNTNKKLVAMPSLGHTSEFPRRDNAYRQKNSLPFDEIQTQIMKNRPRNRRREAITEWVLMAFIGFFTGIIGFIMKIMEEEIIGLAVEMMYHNIGQKGTDNVVPAWLTYAGMSAFYGLLAGLMTTFYGPSAVGSGVAELIGYLNGVNLEGFLKFSTLLTKIFGVVLAVGGKLCVGKEGPLAHIGACIGAGVLYIPGLNLEYLRNDDKKRIYIAAGASAGVSVAFGAPIGGTLFVYELSRPNTFWKFTMLWRVFFCSCMAVFTIAMCNGLQKGTFDDFEWAGSNTKFGQIGDTKNINATKLIPAAILIGIIGGLMGGFFIYMNTQINKLRKKYLTQKWMKPLEAAFFCFMTATAFFLLPYWFGTCNKNDMEHDHPISEGSVEVISENLQKAWCEDGYSNPLATIFWASEGEIISEILSDNVHVTFVQYIIFFFAWYFFTVVTYGTNVPAGLFLPGMILGCAVGNITEGFLQRMGFIALESQSFAVKNFVALGIASCLAGYTRMTYSLAVIIMETAQVINLFVPVLFTIIISEAVGSLFTRSLYDVAIRGK
jgi:H+/Cl- antiporter ClcA